VHPPAVCVSVGAKLLLQGLQQAFPRLEHNLADHCYACALRLWTREQTGIDLETVYASRYVKRYFPDMLGPLGIDKGLHVLSRRWAESFSPFGTPATLELGLPVP
jgi:hypothetical protein